MHASAPVQIVGTTNNDDGSLPVGLGSPVRAAGTGRTRRAGARAFGEAHGLPEYSNRKVECDDMRAWEFAAVAMRLGGASGTYRGQASETACVWMTFGAVTLSQG